MRMDMSAVFLAHPVRLYINAVDVIVGPTCNLLGPLLFTQHTRSLTFFTADALAVGQLARVDARRRVSTRIDARQNRRQLARIIPGTRVLAY